MSQVFLVISSLKFAVLALVVLLHVGVEMGAEVGPDSGRIITVGTFVRLFPRMAACVNLELGLCGSAVRTHFTFEGLFTGVDSKVPDKSGTD